MIPRHWIVSGLPRRDRRSPNIYSPPSVVAHIRPNRPAPPRVLSESPLVELHEVNIGQACQQRLLLHRLNIPNNPKNQHLFWVQYTFHPEVDVRNLQARENFRSIWVGGFLQSCPVAVRIFVDTYHFNLQRLDLD